MPGTDDRVRPVPYQWRRGRGGLGSSGPERGMMITPNPALEGLEEEGQERLIDIEKDALSTLVSRPLENRSQNLTRCRPATPVTGQRRTRCHCRRAISRRWRLQIEWSWWEQGCRCRCLSCAGSRLDRHPKHRTCWYCRRGCPHPRRSPLSWRRWSCRSCLRRPSWHCPSRRRYYWSRRCWCRMHCYPRRSCSRTWRRRLLPSFQRTGPLPRRQD